MHMRLLPKIDRSIADDLAQLPWISVSIIHTYVYTYVCVQLVTSSLPAARWNKHIRTVPSLHANYKVCSVGRHVYSVYVATSKNKDTDGRKQSRREPHASRSCVRANCAGHPRLLACVDRYTYRYTWREWAKQQHT